ncbi:Plastidal glycolate/glycerate translocator 1, chloroplastic [Seminavis robusta]|uniref:Plastidal glycolate/glycerate translocator 1, chloroplastic n=1 Tax=Seminavis robusta TaxID=568900 RepID=A0A9N8DIX7_9STRA|nr:Plastidal glycolate/glycerate translocator 1, chloroplastic [Seminavis robusta]|eukprot:Sro153_g069700.1 Plastidal glycolate/glycerate translocator 1, chloroplastic (530) ;mRNA; f:45184-47130
MMKALHPSSLVVVILQLVSLLSGISDGFQPRIGSHHHDCRTTTTSSSIRPIGGDNKNHNLRHYPPQQQQQQQLKLRSGAVLHQSRQSADTSSSSKTTTTTNPVIAASGLIALDVLFRRVFQLLAISFPSSLAGCGMLFATFLLAPGGGSNLHAALSPGAALLAKWLPVFFVPSLITLPLADSLGSFAEVLKVAAVMVGGFYFTLLTTAWTVVGIRKLLPSKKTAAAVEEETPAKQQAQPTTPPPKPFSDALNNGLRLTTLASAIAAIITTNNNKSPFSSLLTCVFMLSTTLMNFVFGARLPKSFTKIVHPLVTCTSLTWVVAYAFAKATGATFLSVLKSYRTKSMSLATSGAGDLLIFLLGPAVVSLACQMYDRRKLMRENLAEVGAAVGVSAFGGIFGTAAAVRALDLASPYLRLSLLSRNITSPLAMAIASILGADTSFAVTIVVITGLIGANFGASILDKFGITDAVARGLGIGAAAHGLGTAALVNEEDAFPFAAIAMALTASAATVIVSIPVFKRIILQLALGA